MASDASPLDAGMEALRRIRANTVEPRLLDGEGRPRFNVSCYVVNARGEYAGVSLRPNRFAVCTEHGPAVLDTSALLA